MSDQQNERPAGGQWAEQQKEGMEKQEQSALLAEKHPPLSDEEQRKLEDDVVRETSAEEGDERTPDKAQGQIKYAAGQTQSGGGGAGEPQATKLEPEKQGGIGGP